MPTEPKYATRSGGERLETSRPDQTRALSATDFDKFTKDLRKMREEADLILQKLGEPTATLTHDTNFQSVAANFAEREKRLTECRAELRRTIDRLVNEIRNEEEMLKQKDVKSFDTELKKLERDKFMTFKQVVDKELKREDFFKEKAMEMYQATCVNNELNAESPS